jgi:hypothetical protein
MERGGASRVRISARPLWMQNGYKAEALTLRSPRHDLASRQVVVAGAVGFKSLPCFLSVRNTSLKGNQWLQNPVP